MQEHTTMINSRKQLAAGGALSIHNKIVYDASKQIYGVFIRCIGARGIERENEVKREE